MAKKIKKDSTDAAFVQIAFKVQSLYALELLLDVVSRPNSENENHLVGLEVLEDVAHLGGDISLIQTKQYAPGTTFTLNTDVVKKTLCNYLKIWARYPSEDRYYFIFAFSCAIGKENGLKEIAESLNCKKPTTSLLELIKEDSCSDDDYKIIKHILEEYLKSDNDEFSKRLEDMKMEDFKTFLHAVRVKDKSPGYEDLKDALVKKMAVVIEQKTTYSPLAVVHDLVQRIEERQMKDRYFDRCFSNHQVISYLGQISQQSTDPVDPDWSAMDGLEADGVNDKRNLKEKIEAVYPEAREGFLKALNLNLASGKAANLNFKADQRYRALKFKVYRKCFSKMLSLKEAAEINDQQSINQALREMVNEVSASLNEWMRDFKYPITNRDSIEAMILDLIDSCFLKFDPEDDNG